jgi:putative hydrolase of the HAD superfamily
MIVGLVSAGQRPAGGVNLAELDAVTIDGYGTLLTLRDPIGHLDRALRARGVERPASEIARGFDAEVRYYVREKLSGRDAASVATLRAGCAGAFLGELGLELDREEFAPALAFEFDVLPGVHETLARLAAHGLALAVVANWDFSLHDQLRLHGLERWLGAVVLSAELGAAKPDPAPFRAALRRLGVEPGRALHVGDDEADEQGAAAAGMRFAPAPLANLLGAAG